MIRKPFMEMFWLVVGLSLPGVAAIFGFFVGTVLFDVTTEPEEEWQSLDKPPEEIAHFVDADFDNLWVRTVSGKLYGCYWVTGYDNKCWIELEKVPDDKWPDYEAYDGPSYPGPESVEESLAYFYRIRFDTAVKYVRLEDGSVKKWTVGGFRIFRAHNLMGRFLASIFGFGTLGFLSAGAVSILILRRRVFAR